ncbi:MAG: tetratricopeptide repeat protein [Gammaproteobacteria bacterium]
MKYDKTIWAAARNALLAGVIATLTACSSPEEKAAAYVSEAEALFDAGEIVQAKLELRNALQIQPRNAEARYLLALINEQEEKFGRVIANLIMAVESDPSHLAARVKLGNYYAVGEQIEETREQADAAMQLDPDNAAVRVLNARALYMEGDSEGALEQVRIARELDPALREAVTFLVALLTTAGDGDAALIALDDGITSAAGEDVEILRRSKIKVLRQLGDAESAERELAALAADYPESTSYGLALAQLAAEQGRAEEAEERVRDLVEKDPDNAAWRIQLARLLLAVDKAGDAESNLKQAIAADPESGALRLALGGFYEAADRRDDAIATYEALGRANPRTPEGLAARNRVVTLVIDRDEARARAIVADVLVDAPNNVDALLNRAAFNVQDGNLREAIGDLRSAMVKQPDSQRGQLMLARTYLLNGDLELAEDAYRRLVDRYPANRAGRNELASLVGNRGDAEQATALLRETLEMAPGDIGASRNLVRAMLLQQEFAAAETEAQRMLELGETSGAADYQLGQALQAQGEDERAIAAFEAALRRNPESEDALNDLVQLLVNVDRKDDAQTYLQRHIDAYPNLVLPRLLLGELYRADGRNDAARAVFEELAARQPEAIGAYIGVAATLAPGSDEQLAALMRGLEENAGDSRLGLAVGSFYKQRQDYDAAIEVYDGIVRLNGGDDMVVNNLAALLLDHRTDQQSHARALELASRFESGATHPFNLGVLGWAYHRNGQSTRAVRYLERAVAEVGGNPKLRYYLGMAILGDGDEIRARQQLEQAISAADAAGGTFDGYDEAVATLEQLRSGGA